MSPVTAPSRLEDLPTPAAVVDLDVLERNLDRMQARAEALGVALRPHAKTHKCVEIARLQLERGARGVTVSTLEEARAFADHGITDLTWAFPVILTRLGEVEELAARTRLGLLVDSLEAVAALEERGFSARVWLKVDCGYGRAGVRPDSEHALAVARAIERAESLELAGILTHGGQAYHGERAEAARTEQRVMAELSARLSAAGIAVRDVSVGSTPGMSAAEDLAGVTEARPGNYAFFDGMQVGLGAARVEDCALTIEASVVSSQPGAEHAVVDAGALSLSADGPVELEDGEPAHGWVLDRETGNRVPGLHLTGLSQEHGLLSRPLPVGRRVRIVPVHSCLAAACFDHYWVVRGDRVLDRWRVWRSR